MGEIDRELRYHFEKLVRDYVAEGMTESEARRRARIEFGGIEQVTEECRDVRGRWLEDFGKDLQYAARTLRRSPGFLVVAVLSLALGIGANTAIFSLINAVMLRMLPVKEPGRLVQICRLGEAGRHLDVSYPVYVYLCGNMKLVWRLALELETNTAITYDGCEDRLG